MSRCSKYYVVAEAGCIWYHFDINIFPLSKKTVALIFLRNSPYKLNLPHLTLLMLKGCGSEKGPESY
jgi:hypothetical protein